MLEILSLVGEHGYRFKLLTLSAVLLLANSAYAVPRWVKKVAKVAVYTAPVVTAVLATKGGLDCRHRNGVEPCTAHYGEFWGTEAGRYGVSITMSGLSLWGHKQGFKEWFAPAVGISAFNSYWYLRESRIHTEREK